MSSAAALSSSAMIYREHQRFVWWLYLLAGILLGLGLTGLAQPRDPAASLFSLANWPKTAGLIVTGLSCGLFLAMRMTTVVDGTHLKVGFGWIPLVNREFALIEVRHAEVVRYRPLKDFGSWGVRTGPDGLNALTARGDEAVMIRLADGSRWLIGTQAPEDLLAALRSGNPSLT